MKKILIVTALSQELNVIKNEIKKLKIKNLKVSYFSTGMGNYNMILNLTKFLVANSDFDFVLNIGICGYFGEKKDFFQVARIYNLANKKELIVPNIINFGDLESIFCSEKVIFDKSEIKTDEKIFLDMESFGFEKTLESFFIPRIILKVPIDKIGEETKNFDFKKSEKNLKENIDYEKLLEKILKYLEKNDKKNDFIKYENIYNFTFSEKSIFKKSYFKFKSITGENFDEYLEKYKTEDKKIFLKELEIYLKKFMI